MVYGTGRTKTDVTEAYWQIYKYQFSYRKCALSLNQYFCYRNTFSNHWLMSFSSPPFFLFFKNVKRLGYHHLIKKGSKERQEFLEIAKPVLTKGSPWSQSVCQSVVLRQALSDLPNICKFSEGWGVPSNN